MKKIITLILMLAVACVALTGCFSSEADKVNHNLTKKAERFECERKITVYNARTDMILLELEGYIDISNNDSKELVVTVRTGADTYKKNYIYLNSYTLYVVEDITGTHADPYHYEIYYHTSFPIEVTVTD